MFSGGETITVPGTKISDLATFISFSAIQSNSVIFHRAATLLGHTEHYFLVDSYTFQVLIFINGRSIVVSAITTPQGKLMHFSSFYEDDILIMYFSCRHRCNVFSTILNIP